MQDFCPAWFKWHDFTEPECDWLKTVQGEPVFLRKDTGSYDMFIAYFLLFILFNGKVTLEIVLFGVVFAAVLYAFSCRYLGYSFGKDVAMVRGSVDGVRYLIMLAMEIVKANLTVIRMVLTPGFEPKPKLVQFRSGLRSDGHRVALADSITLTPGTITCELSGDLFTVHCLDNEQYEGIENSCFQKALSRMEERALERQRDTEMKKKNRKAESDEADSHGGKPGAEEQEALQMSGDSVAADEMNGQEGGLE